MNFHFLNVPVKNLLRGIKSLMSRSLKQCLRWRWPDVWQPCVSVMFFLTRQLNVHLYLVSDGVRTHLEPAAITVLFLIPPPALCRFQNMRRMWPFIHQAFDFTGGGNRLYPLPLLIPPGTCKNIVLLCWNRNKNRCTMNGSQILIKHKDLFFLAHAGGFGFWCDSRVTALMSVATSM